MTKADRDVVQEIMMMMLGDAALSLLDHGTDTTKNEAANRSLSVSLPKNVNFSRAGYNRMHSTISRLNHGPGESSLKKLEVAGAPPVPGSKPAKFFCRRQQTWERAQRYSKSRKRKLERIRAERKQRSEHYTSKAARKVHHKYRKFQLDDKVDPAVGGAVPMLQLYQ